MRRPKSVTFGIGLVICGLAVGFVNTYLFWDLSVEIVGKQKTSVNILGPTLLVSAALMLTWRRFNWARIVLITLLSVASFGFVFSFFGRLPDISKLVKGIQLILYLTSIAMLLSSSSSTWFKSKDSVQ